MIGFHIPLSGLPTGGFDLNDVHDTADYYDARRKWREEVRRAIAAAPEAFARRLYPSGKLSQNRQEWCVADITGRAPKKAGSFVVTINGTYAGHGLERDDGQHYSPRQMVAAVYGLDTDSQECWEALAELVGVAPFDADTYAAPIRRTPSLAQEPAPAPRQKASKAGDIGLILPQRQPIAGTLAEAYLRGRGLEIPLTDDLFFAADVTDQGARIGRPAMVGIIRDGAGNQLVGVHRTFLNADGTKEKKWLGDCAGGAIRLYPIGGDGRLGAAEGIETSIAAQMRYGIPTWAALSAGNLGNFDIPTECRELFIFADHGNAGTAAADKLKARAEAAGVAVYVVYPVGDDDHAQDHEDGLPLAEIGAAGVSIRGLKPADLGGVGYQDAIDILKNTTDEQEAAAVALAIVHKFARRVPVAQSADQFIGGLTSLAPISAGTAAELRQRLDYITQRRKAGLLGLTSLSRTATARHDHHRVTDLSFSPFDDGVVVVKAPHGQGKTQKIGRPFADFSRQQGERFAAVCHRISLAAELANRLGAEDYRTSESVQSDALAICVNSVTGRHDGYCDTVENLFVDEVSQVLRHIALGSFTDNRIAVFNRFVSMIRNAKRVIVADADMNDMTLAFLEHCRPNERFAILESTTKATGLAVTWDYGRGASNAAMGDILCRLANGERVIVATDSVKKPRTLAELIGNELPEKRVLVIDRDHGGKAQQAFLANPNAEVTKYDCIIHSPSVSSGVSIEAHHFDHGYGLFFGAVTPSDALQMLRRARTVRQWHISFDANNPGDKADADVLADGLAQAGMLSSGVGTLTDFDNLKLKALEWEAAGKADFAFAMLGLLESYGFTTERVRLSDDDLDAVDEARAMAEARYISGIVNARWIGSDRAERLRKSETRTDAEVMAMKRHAIRSKLRLGTVTESDVLFWNDGRGFAELERYEVAAGLRTDDDRTDHLSLRKFVALRHRLYGEILAPINIDLLSGEGSFADEDAAEMVARVKRTPTLLVALRMVPNSATKEIKYPVRFVGSVLGMLGLETEDGPRPRVDGVRRRTYRLNRDKLKTARGYAERRKKAADAIAARASSGPHSANYSIQKTPNLDHLTDPSDWFPRTRGSLVVMLPAPEFSIKWRWYHHGLVIDLNEVEPLAHAA